MFLLLLCRFIPNSKVSHYQKTQEMVKFAQLPTGLNFLETLYLMSKLWAFFFFSPNIYFVLVVTLEDHKSEMKKLGISGNTRKMVNWLSN